MDDTPLEGLRVLDLTRVLAGPYCTQTMADMGADVVKVESPAGDDTRRWGPPFAGGIATYYLAVNRGKRSLVLDLKAASAREVRGDLIAWADVLLENFRPGGAARLGADYGSTSKRNPRLVSGAR